jgi:hypothetical protein
VLVNVAGGAAVSVAVAGGATVAVMVAVAVPAGVPVGVNGISVDVGVLVGVLVGPRVGPLIGAKQEKPRNLVLSNGHVFCGPVNGTSFTWQSNPPKHISVFSQSCPVIALTVRHTVAPVCTGH